MSATVKVYAMDGSAKGSAELPADLFGQPVNEHLLWMSVKRHLGNQRQGTAAVKNRAMVSGGGKKPFKQKGTGRARQGSNTSPLMPGGGRTFGPQPKSWRTDLPKQQRRAALASALSLKASENAVSILDQLSVNSIKTSSVAAVLKSLGIYGKRTLLIVGEHDDTLWKSCRNIRTLSMTVADRLNAYELLHCEAVVLTSAGLKRVQEVHTG